MTRSQRRTTRLVVQQLEERCTPAGTIAWPIQLPAGQSLSLYSTYGQFTEAGGLHLHEGIDIIAPAGTAVFAREPGTITGLSVPGTPAPQNFISVSIGTTHGWNYGHVNPGINPATGVRWVVGANFTAGQQLGTVEAMPIVFGHPPTHLHLDYTETGADPLMVDLRRPIADPLAYLQSLNDTVRPTVSNDIHFRTAATDTNGTIYANAATGRLAGEEPAATHLYFHSADAGNRLIMGERAPTRDANGTNSGGTADIDIIIGMYDEMLTGGRRIGPKDVSFRLTGQKWGADTGVVNSFRFAGDFLRDVAGPPAGHNYHALRHISVVRTIYENDVQSDSGQGGPYWHIVTNTAGGATLTTAADRARFWNSNVTSGSAWNDTAAADAPRNAAAQFPDDFYVVWGSGWDEASNQGTNTRTVLLDNFLQTVTTDNNIYLPNQNVVVTGGENYRANQNLALHVLMATPVDGAPLPAATIQANVTTDADGRIPNRNLGPFALGDYWIVADYNQDGIYEPRLDGITHVLVANNMVNLSAPVPLASETGPNPGTFLVTRSFDGSDLTVNYSSSGLAVSGFDYAPLSGSVVIPSGSLSATITVTPLDDSISEGAEGVTLTLDSDANYVIGPSPSGTVTIADNDLPPGSSAPFFDTFTDADGTQITSHTSDSGHTWISHSGGNLTAGTTASSADGKIKNNRYYMSNQVWVYYSSYVPTSDDYMITGVLYKATSANTYQDLWARLWTGIGRGYLVRYGAANDDFRFYRGDGNVLAPIEIASYLPGAGTYADGSSITVDLIVSGASFTVRVDGVTRITATDSSWSTGRIGIGGNGSSATANGDNGVNLESIQVIHPPTTTGTSAPASQQFTIDGISAAARLSSTGSQNVAPTEMVSAATGINPGARVASVPAAASSAPAFLTATDAQPSRPDELFSQEKVDFSYRGFTLDENDWFSEA